MALTPGTRLGVYEVTAPIGQGGMGQVFRARDTRLSRSVAIKVLPDAFAHDPERLARFTREAQTLASLNHPHIAAVYGFEEFRHDASAPAPTLAIVMELVEGDDLSAVIARGALPIEEALPIARQIAEALEAAHEQGIVHRDLKPANIKLGRDGTVKVLDFGLAKPTQPTATGPGPLQPIEGGAASLDTVTSPDLTTVGVVRGTAAYMSPEQAAGRPVDKRTDIWAFGAVVMEMLTGRRVFTGATVSDVIASVLKSEPDWTLLPANTPATIRTLLRRCLEKDRKRRLTDAGAARLEIDESLTAPAATPGRSDVVPRSTASGRWWLPGAALVVAATAVALAWAPWRSAPPPPETRTDIVTPATDSPMMFVLSPDGQHIAFVASGGGVSRLWIRSLSTTTAQPLTGTEGAMDPFWAPDSRTVAFFADGVLKRVDVRSGAPETVAVTPGNRGGTWSADGVILFASSAAGPLFQVPATGGAPVAVTTLDRQSSHRWPYFLPDGRRFVFFAQGTPDTTGIYLGSLDTPATHRLTAADTAGVVLPAAGSGDAVWLLWVRAGTLVAQRLSLDSTAPALTGDLASVAEPVAADTTFSLAAVSVSAAGLVAYREGGNSRRALRWFDRSGKALGSLGAPEDSNLLYPSLSPDGRQVAVNRTVQGNQDVWVTDGESRSRFTFDGGIDRLPIWSAGGQIVFSSNRQGPYHLFQKVFGGSAGEDALVTSPQTKVATDASADGRFLLYYSVDPRTGRDLWVKPLSEDGAPWAFLQTPNDERYGAFSPDGRWVAYQSNESGRMEIYLRPFAGRPESGAGTDAGGAQWQVSTSGGIMPRWRHDGRELYFLSPGGAMMAAPIAVNGTAIAPGTPALLFPTRIAGGGADLLAGRQYDVTRDGRFLLNTALDEVAAPITLIQHWRPQPNQ